MKRLLLLSLLVSSVCFAQRNTYGSFNGWGSVANPGTGHPPVPRGGYGGLPPAGGYNRGGFIGNGINARPNAYRRAVIGYPVYIGGGYYPGYGDYAPQPPVEQPPPNITIINAPPAAPAPPVTINQYFGPPPAQAGETEESGVHIYSQQPRPPVADPATAPEQRYYLIAYKDHSVYTAIAYWVEDHTLHYVTGQNTHNQADLSLIDTEFTKKLNSDRNVGFALK